MVELECKYMMMMCLCVSGMGWIRETVEGQVMFRGVKIFLLPSHLLNVVMTAPQCHYCTSLLLCM